MVDFKKLRKKRSLYAVVDAIEEVIQRGVDPETGEMSDAIAEELDALDMETEERALAVATAIKGLRLEASMVAATAEAIREQAATEAKRAGVLGAQADKLEAYIDEMLFRAKRKPANGAKFVEIHNENASLKYRKSTVVDVLEPAMVPANYRLDPPKERELLPSKKKIAEGCKKRNVTEMKIKGTVVARLREKQTLHIS